MVVQIARTALRPNVNFHFALRQIFGLGRSNSIAVAEACGISNELKVRDVKPAFIAKVAAYIQENHVVGDSLKRAVRANILQLVDIKCRRGTRHELALPISARTHTNAKTARVRKYLDLYDTSK